jgi:hypothetical protein
MWDCKMSKCGVNLRVHRGGGTYGSEISLKLDIDAGLMSDISEAQKYTSGE